LATRRSRKLPAPGERHPTKAIDRSDLSTIAIAPKERAGALDPSKIQARAHDDRSDVSSARRLHMERYRP
jgi:hypothetical protein